MTTTARDLIGRMVTIRIDRPLGSRHPEWGHIYPVNYGYVPGVIGGDGEPLDAYVLGEFAPLEQFTGLCTAVIRRLNDDDDKLVLVPPGKDYSNAQIHALVEFQERYFQAEILRE